MAAQVANHLDPVCVSIACFNIGGHLFQIPVEHLASERGRTTKLWQAVKYNFDSRGKQVDSELHFDRDCCTFPHICDFLCGKELNIQAFPHSHLHRLRDEASFFGIGHLVQLLDLHLAEVVKASVVSPKSETPLQQPAQQPPSHEDQSSESSSVSAQGSWHSNSSSSPAETPVAPRKRKISEPSRAHKRSPAYPRTPVQRNIISTTPATPQPQSSSSSLESIGDQPSRAADANSDPSARKCEMCSVSQSSGRRPMLWRRGPNGPKTLCNNCGIKWYFQQKRAGLVGAPEKRGRKPFMTDELAGSEEEDQSLAGAN